MKKDEFALIEIDSLDVKTRPVKIAGAAHTLTELTGKERDVYLSKSTGRVKYQKGHAAGLSTLDGHQADLITLCLTRDSDKKKYTAEEVQVWSATAQQTLFDACRKLSKIGRDEEETEKDEAEAKND